MDKSQWKWEDVWNPKQTKVVYQNGQAASIYNGALGNFTASYAYIKREDELKIGGPSS